MSSRNGGQTTGLRAGELTALRVRHLDLDEGGLVLEAAWTKNRKAGFQPLPQWLVLRLGVDAKGKAPDAPLLYVPTHPARDLEEDLKAAGIPKWTPDGKLDFHAARVAYVSWLVESGASVKEVQTLARHATPTLTMNTYARTRPERLSSVVEALGESLRQAPSTTEAQRAEALAASASADKASLVEAAGIEPDQGSTVSW